MLSDGENGRAAKAAQTAEAVVLALAEGSEHDMLAATAGLIKDKPLFTETAERMQLLFRDACMVKNNVNISSQGTLETAKRLAKRLPLQNLLALCELSAQYAGYVGRNANMALLVSSLCAKMRETAGR